MKITLTEYKKRIKNDEYYTPRYAIEPLLEYLPKGITIWECTDYGKSNITTVLREKGYNVIPTKKEDFNFLEDKPTFDFDMIITNPPYSLKDEFLKKCYEYGKPFCLLLPITTLEGIKRGKLFRKNGIKLLVLDKRIEFVEGKCNWFNASWFCWNVLNEGLIFKEIVKEE